MSAPLLTLLTDFGTADHRAAVLTAHVLRHSPPTARIIPVTHQVAPFNLAHAAYVLSAAFPEFPLGTIHVVAVAGHTGGVGEVLAAEFRGHFFILPDNGLLTLLTDGAPAAVVRLPRHPGPARALLGIAAGHLASGRPLEDLGEPAETVVELRNRTVRITDDRLSGHIIHVDHFGNLVTNLTRDAITAVGAERSFTVRFGREAVPTIMAHYGEAEPGDIACVFDSRGHLCIGLNRGHAAELLGLTFDGPVEVVFRNA